MKVEGQSAAQYNSTAAGTMSSTEGDMFMKLLMTQLQTQDPLSPADPTQFVSQLVDFNTLGEVTKIRELVESATIAPAAAE